MKYVITNYFKGLKIRRLDTHFGKYSVLKLNKKITLSHITSASCCSSLVDQWCSLGSCKSQILIFLIQFFKFLGWVAFYGDFKRLKLPFSASFWTENWVQIKELFNLESSVRNHFEALFKGLKGKSCVYLPRHTHIEKKKNPTRTCQVGANHKKLCETTCKYEKCLVALHILECFFKYNSLQKYYVSSRISFINKNWSNLIDLSQERDNWRALMKAASSSKSHVVSFIYKGWVLIHGNYFFSLTFKWWYHKIKMFAD